MGILWVQKLLREIFFPQGYTTGLVLHTIQIPLLGHSAKCRFGQCFQRHPEMDSQKEVVTGPGAPGSEV